MDYMPEISWPFLQDLSDANKKYSLIHGFPRQPFWVGIKIYLLSFLVLTWVLNDDKSELCYPAAQRMDQNSNNSTPQLSHDYEITQEWVDSAIVTNLSPWKFNLI